MGIIILGYVGSAVFLRFLFGPEVPSNIVDFHPTQFPAQTDEQLPKDTRVYVALTTKDIPHYRISCGGIMAN